MPSGGGYGQRPSRLSRIDLGQDDDDEDLDYSEHAGPSNPPRHSASSSRAYPPARPDPRSVHRTPLSYHDIETSSRHDPHPRTAAHYTRPPPHPRSRTSSPQPDKDVLDYIRAQKEQGTSTSKLEKALAEQLKREKFEHGAGKVKSRVQKEREAEERKKKQAQEDAAKAYEEFVAAMGGDGEHGATEDKDHQKKKPMGFVAAGGKAYVGSRPAQPESAHVAAKPPLKRVNSAFGDDSSGDETSTLPRKDPPPPARKRHAAMSSFLTELQTEQAQRKSRLSTLASTTNTSISTLLAHETLSKPGSRDLAADPLTTNICVLSLPAHVDERTMGEFFRAWGDVATVKIMWPRGEQRERVGGLTGFVAYMTRREAENAFREADGVVWGGTRVKMSWGKAMPLPARAMYPMSSGRKDEKRVEDGRQARDGASSSAVPKLVIRHRRSGTSTDDTRQSIQSKVHDDYPQTQRLFIETVASRIRSTGAHFEHVLREREADNPKFSFLFETHSELHHYFRMCLDPHYAPTPREPEPDFADTGSDELYSTDSGEESETRRLARSTASTGTASVPLGALARRRLCSMLRGLTLRRERIARVTAFALDHAASYAAVVALLTASLLQPCTPVPRKLARLYALSDVLHNSGTPISNAWRYRAALEAQLPLVFAHLGQVVGSFAGRMKREEVRARVVGVLDVWEGWIVVSPHVLERLRRLVESPLAVRGKDVDGEALDDARTADGTTQHNDAEEEEDLDGEAL